MIDDEISLGDIDEEKIDLVLSLNEQAKSVFFDSLITRFYPSVDRDSDYYYALQAYYRGSWVAEKLYRNNQYLKDYFSVVYTKTGLIRNIWNDMYFTDDDLILH